jgi:hypothetical protein
LQISAEKSSGVAFVCLVLCVSACGDPEPVAAMQTPGCGSDGALVVEIYGGVRASIDWDAGVLECQGMPRPDGEGARLRFAEGTGRFFGTRDTANCWTDIETHERIQSAKSSDYRISGILYCVAPIVGLDGNSSISFADLTFTGRVAWEPPK